MAAFCGVALGQSRVASPSKCTVKNSSTRVGEEPVKPPLTLQPEANSQSRVLNFDVNRDPKFATFFITAEPALPPGFEGRLNLVADTILRTGNDKTETVLFPEPEFSAPRISGNRKRISFDVCLDPPANLSAGRYSGLVTLEGPTGVESTAVTVTVNAKNGDLFLVGIVVTTLLALAILFYKEAGAKRTAAQAAAGDDATEKQEAEKWGPQLFRTLIDVGWWVPTLFALGAMIGALLALWDNNPSWGDSGINSVAALIGAGMAAIGAREIFIPRSRDTT